MHPLGLFFFVVVIGSTVACDKKPTPEGATTSATSAAAGDPTFKVVADENGYAPSAVTLRKGHAASIQFTRTSDKTCAREVEFPELHIKKDLPLNTPVTIALPAGEARKYTFQCGMAMYKGTVVVTE